ncbi:MULTISPECIES: helix-turn-helix domain-containing protein [Pseudomonas]|uniref:helix-turn-helix domain-containing protein n=1 Tax=Pseudomonas TaxID=286 RepID=UPI00069D08B8|nr:AraC family transcriptional regulator [Pseudomonas sp. Pf153]MCE0460524.1 AraC family transcriptional regulator [Pseudomonas uvaldensis]
MAALQKISQSYRVAPTHSRLISSDACGWTRQQLPGELGECYSERYLVDNDLMVVRSRYRPTRHLIEETASPHNRHMLVITFGMQGDSGYKGADGSTVSFRAGYTTITSFQLSLGERCYEAGTTVSQLRLLIGESMLNRYIGEQRTRQLLGNGNVRQLAFQKTSATSASHATALARYLNQGATGALDMHIHTLSLLSEQLKLISPPTPCIQNPQLSASDIEKLDRARDIMLEQMDQPLTIPYLCAAVGLNEFKLKEGLHHRFNSTPHRMLHEMRMRKAYTLLESGCQVAQAAYQVGYKFPNNFSAAFTRFFGKSPKTVFGKRR